MSLQIDKIKGPLMHKHKTGDFPVPVITSIDGSVIVNGLDLSVKRPEMELYASNEAELLAAWTIANAYGGSVRIYITGSVTFTANRQFIRAYASPSIKFEAITPIYFIAGSYVVDYGNIVFTNITFRTETTFYLRVVGGVATFNNCGWIDDVRDASLGDTPKKNIVIIDPVTSQTGKIILKGVTHFTQTAIYNNTALIQPFWIENQATFGLNIYIENLEMSAVSEAARFSRVLLTSTVANCPYKVTGDESWFFAPAQELPGVGNIAASAQILRVTTVDKFNAARFATNNIAPYTIGIMQNGDAIKMDNIKELVINFIDLTPVYYKVPKPMIFLSQVAQGTAATLNPLLNTALALYDILTITPVTTGQIILKGILL